MASSTGHNLDDPALYVRLDPSGLRERLRDLPRHCLAGWRKAHAWSLPEDWIHNDKVVIGGMGSILGSFMGAAFITSVPILLTNLPPALGLQIDVALLKHFEVMFFGALIIFFLAVEPGGLARLWQIAKEKLRLWPFPH